MNRRVIRVVVVRFCKGCYFVYILWERSCGHIDVGSIIIPKPKQKTKEKKINLHLQNTPKSRLILHHLLKRLFGFF